MNDPAIEVHTDVPASNSGTGLWHRRTVHVTWGDCDRAGIIFYPRYYEMFDASTHAMLGNLGLGHRQLEERYGTVGLSLVEAKATFVAPATFDDVLESRCQITRIGRSSLTVDHRILKGTQEVVRGHEVRVWARETAPGTIEASPLPPAVRVRLGGNV